MSSHSQASSSRQGRRRGSTTTQQKPSSSHEQLADQMQQQLKVTEQAQALPVVEQNTVIETKKMHSRKNQYGRWINNYLILNQLGKGQHGDVWLAREPVSKRYVAIKMVKRKNPKADRLFQFRQQHGLPKTPHTQLTDRLSPTEEKIRREIAIMKKIRHPHVVRLIEVIDDDLDERIFLVMEYLAGGEIRWRTTDNHPALRVDQVRRICRDVILGLDYLHSIGIIHRDIKPANLLWTDDRIMVKIADFGVSHYSFALHHSNLKLKAISEKDVDPLFRDDSELSRFAGTPMFLAPEVVHDATGSPDENSRSSTTLNRSGSNLQLEGHSFQPSTHTPVPISASSSLTPSPLPKRAITKAIDVWAFGITLYALLFGNIPWTKENEFAIYQAIRNDDWEVPETMGCDKIPVGGRRQKAPRRPQDATEGYLVIDLLEKLLEKDADKRITLDGVRRHPWILRDMSESEVRNWVSTTEANGASLTDDSDSTPTIVTDEEQNRAITRSWFNFGTVARIGSSLLKSKQKISSNGGRLTRGFGRSNEPSGSNRGDGGKDSGKHEKSSRGWRLGRGKDKDEAKEKDVGVQSAPAGVLYNADKTADLERRKKELLAQHQKDQQRQASGSKDRKSQVTATRHQSMMDVGTSSSRSHASRSSKSHRSGGGGRNEEEAFKVSSMWNDGAPSRFPSARRNQRGSETLKQTGHSQQTISTTTSAAPTNINTKEGSSGVSGGTSSVTSTPTKRAANLMLHNLQLQTQTQIPSPMGPGQQETLQVPGHGTSMSPSTALTTTATTMTTATATSHHSRLLSRRSNSRVGSPQPPPTPSSAVGSSYDTSPLHTPAEERPKSRNSLHSLLNITSWIPNFRRSSTYAPSTSSQTTQDPPPSAYPATSASTSPSSSSPPTSRFPPTQGIPDIPRDRDNRYMALGQRRSVDAFAGTGMASSRQSSGSEGFALAVRASSWGEFDDYGRPSEDHTSLYSGGGPIDDDAYFIGAGGVARSPVSSLPTSGALSRVSSSVSLGPSTSLSAAQIFMQQRGNRDRDGDGDLSSVPNPIMQDPTVLARQGQSRSRQHGTSMSQSTSPLARPSFSRAESSNHSQSTERSPSRRYEDVFDSDDEDDDVEGSDDRSSGLLDPQPSMSELYQQEDEESDSSSEEIRLEVKTRRASEVKPRRPSVTITEASPSGSPAPFNRRQPSPGHHLNRLSVAREASPRRSAESDRSISPSQRPAVACR